MVIVNREELIKGMAEDMLFLNKVENAICLGNPREINQLLVENGEQAINAKYEVGDEFLYRAWPFVLKEENGQEFNFLAADLGNSHFNFICELTHEAIMTELNKMSEEHVSSLLAEQCEMIRVFKEEKNSIDQDNLAVFESAVTEIQKQFKECPRYLASFDFTKKSAYDISVRLVSYKKMLDFIEHIKIDEDVMNSYQSSLANLEKRFEYICEVSRMNAVHAELSE